MKKIKEEMANLASATQENIDKAKEEHIKTIDEKFLARVKVEEQELQAKFPNFSVKKEMEKNPLFAVMLVFNESVEDVYYYFNKDILTKQIEKEVIEKIKARDVMPDTISASGKTSKFNVDNLTEKDIEEIDKRVRRGEKVTF